VLGVGRVPDPKWEDTGDELHMDSIAAALEAAARDAGIDAQSRPIADLGVYCLAGADLPADDRRIVRGLARRGFAAETVLRNDTFAVLRAGTERDWGVGVVCGFGTNCSGVAPDGRQYRLAAFGAMSGDWGGGAEIGQAALWHALRARDGRGGRTALETSVPAWFGLRTPRQVMERLYFRRLDPTRLAELAPVVFRDASEGDQIARALVDRQADEIVLMAGAAIRRLGMRELDVDVVLGGGIFRNRFPPFFERIQTGLREVAERARMVVLDAPPVVGAAMLALDRIGASRRAKASARDAVTHARLSEIADDADAASGGG
jgi:N-acetylglucosamine kinase-like BadF-type ATPase